MCITGRVCIRRRDLFLHSTVRGRRSGTAKVLVHYGVRRGRELIRLCRCSIEMHPIVCAIVRCRHRIGTWLPGSCATAIQRHRRTTNHTTPVTVNGITRWFCPRSSHLHTSCIGVQRGRRRRRISCMRGVLLRQSTWIARYVHLQIP